jgi:hypothetical protein
MSIFNQWDESRYVADAFAAFNPARDANPALNPDLGTARGLMWAAQLVYELDTINSLISLDKVKRIVAKFGMDFVDRIPVPGFAPDIIRAVPLLSIVVRDALIIKGRGALIVAFAGTDPPRLQDWLVNFALLPAATGVSMGFGDVAAAFAPLIKRHADRHNDLKVLVTGHSLGGALGVAVAAALDSLGCPVEAVHTFGMPRAGDLAFRDNYNGRLGDRTFRFVHGDDLVPTVPPANVLGLAHFHVGSLIQCDIGAKFALSRKNKDTTSNEPRRDDDIASGLLAPTGFIDRSMAAFRTFASGGDLVAASIAGLPPRLRHHLQDQYIAALTP